MDAAEWNSGNARHSAERARDLLVEVYIYLEPSAQRAIVRVHRLNQCPIYRSANKAGALDWRRHMKNIVDEDGEIIAKATDDHTLIGGHHRLAVAASLGRKLFWKDTGEPVKLDPFFKGSSHRHTA